MQTTPTALGVIFLYPTKHSTRGSKNVFLKDKPRWSLQQPHRQKPSTSAPCFMARLVQPVLAALCFLFSLLFIFHRAQNWLRCTALQTEQSSSCSAAKNKSQSRSTPEPNLRNPPSNYPTAYLGEDPKAFSCWAKRPNQVSGLLLVSS